MLKEIGDSSSKGFNWRLVKEGLNYIGFFQTSSGTNYEVIFEYFYESFDISFVANNQTTNTNKNEVYAVMTTIIAMTKEVLKREPKINELSFEGQPDDFHSISSQPSKRTKLFKIYLKKLLPNWELDEQGNSIVFRKANTLKEYNISKLLRETLTSVADFLNLKAAVAVVLKDNKVLMGISASLDDRYGKLCFPGGGIEANEAPDRAACREAWEETGVKVICNPENYVILDSQPQVIFYLCFYQEGTLNPNEEFQGLAWYDLDSLDKEKMYKNNNLALEFLKQKANIV